MRNKKFLFWTSVVILIPTFLGLLLWNQLPEKLPTHWGIDGQIDGWSSKHFAIFAVPLILLAFQWICIGVTRLDKQNQSGGNEKVMYIVFSLFPALSLFTAAGMYGSFLGWEFRVENLMPGLIGLMFLILGNFLPKCRQNSSLGIKLPWTFSSEENWNKTHRLGGKVWVACGVALLIAAVLDWTWLFLGGIFGAMLIPTVYSWLLYRKQQKAGAVAPLPKQSKLGITIASILSLVTLAFVFFILFSGSLEITVDETALTITTDRWDDLAVDTAAIDSAEYRADGVEGSRSWGYGNLKLLLGSFENEEFGTFTRYTFAACDQCIVLRVDGRTLVINAEDDEATWALYDQITELTE